VSDIRDAVERGWREMQALDAALARREIEEDAWYRERQALIVPAYLAADNPRAQSGQSGDEAGWEDARSLIVEAIGRDGTFLDVGCANGHLMETVREWAAHRGIEIEPYGVDLSPELAALARRRLPRWADRIWVGNGLTWQPPFRFDFVHLQQLDYVPPLRRRELVAHLLDRVCTAGGRLIVGSFNEPRESRATEAEIASYGYAIAGRAERDHPRDARVTRRVLWIDAPR
jgi:SAM-dependent methyltransferase